MKQLFLAIGLLSATTGFAQQRYTIVGKIDGWKGTDSLTLVSFAGTEAKQEPFVAKDGRFTLSGEFTTPFTAALRLDKPARADVKGAPRDNIRIWIEAGKITLTSKDSLKNARIVGGPLNADAIALKNATSPITNKMGALRIQAMKATKEEREMPAFKALNDQYSALIKELNAANADFIRKHPKSLVALTQLNEMAGARIDYEKIAPLYAALDSKLKATALGVELGERIKVAAQTIAGAVMPNFLSYDTARAPLELKTVLASSKLTLVDFWASWCGPCRAENPNVVKAFEAFKAKGFNIISVSLDDNADRWKAAIIKDGMPWYHVSGLKKWDEPVAKQFGVNAVPDNYLLDAEGKVVGRGLRGDALYEAIAARLK